MQFSYSTLSSNELKALLIIYYYPSTPQKLPFGVLGNHYIVHVLLNHLPYKTKILLAALLVL